MRHIYQQRATCCREPRDQVRIIQALKESMESMETIYFHRKLPKEKTYPS